VAKWHWVRFSSDNLGPPLPETLDWYPALIHDRYLRCHRILATDNLLSQAVLYHCTRGTWTGIAAG
jgi:hypothetical protein